MKLWHGVGIAALFVAGLAAAFCLGRRTAGEGTSANLPGPVDVGFSQSMRDHHGQAVVMTQILLGRGTTQLAGLARAIQADQLVEIGQMKGWLLLWGKPMLPSKAGMDWILTGKTAPGAALTRYLADCKVAGGGMPGLATSDELNQLRSAVGPERDQLFLKLMVRHHQGALPMADFAAKNAETSTVRTLAAQIVIQQEQELAAMAAVISRK